MTSPGTSPTSGVIRRTSHACSQCRERKQKCGGFTTKATCTTCQLRKVRCSFEEEARDPRYNPYLRIQTVTPSRSGFGSIGSPNDLPFLQPDMMESNVGVHGDSGAAETDGSSQMVNGNGSAQTSDNVDLRRQLSQIQARLDRMESQAHVTHRTDDLRRTSLKGQDMSRQSSTLQSSSPIKPWHTPTLTQYPVDIPSHGYVQPAPTFVGPLRTLSDLGVDDPFDNEDHDPVSRQILTYGEACVAFRIFFERCHPNAPFLDFNHDYNVNRVRSASVILFLNIVVVAARFWGHPNNRETTWLHPRYQYLTSLLDAEINRLLLRPRASDQTLETVQAFMIYSHWMPLDISPDGSRHRSRFSESSAWQCLGLAIRWATLLGLQRSAHLPFGLSRTATTLDDVRVLRTMMYLTESDHYLALSARRPPTLSTVDIYAVLRQFLMSEGVQATDSRLTALIRVVHAAQLMGDRSTSLVSFEAFNHDVHAVERDFTMSSRVSSDYDKMSQHFPFTSLRWYRLAFASALLPYPHNWRTAGEPLRQSVDWASQILFHLSSFASPTNTKSGVIDAPLEPDVDLVELLSFAIDHYFVVIAYTASFLVLAWQNGAIDSQLEIASTSSNLNRSRAPSPKSSILYRLVDLAARTLDACAPPKGYLAARYATLLRGMANIIASSQPAPSDITFSSSMAPATANFNDVDQIQNNSFASDQELLALWQQAGLDYGSLFGSLDTSAGL